MVESLKRAGVDSRKRGDQTEFKVNKLETPWIHIRHHPETNCYLWRDIVYNFISKAMPTDKKFIHSGCQRCYKVVVKPRTYRELLSFDSGMHAMDMPSKIGIDRRMYIKGALYGAYFYARGLEDARRIAEKLKMGTEGHIKRGCTEMEIDHGPSDKWEVKDFQPELEYCAEKMIFSPKQPEQTEKQKDEIRLKWRAFAYKFDPTYAGKELFPKTVTYE